MKLPDSLPGGETPDPDRETRWERLREALRGGIWRQTNALRIVALALLIALPVIGYIAYRMSTALPRKIVIATGSEGGRYFEIGKALEDAIEDRHPRVDVVVVTTAGSLENLHLLRDGEVDLALYQPGVEELLATPLPGPDQQVAFVANLYLQPTHIVVRKGLANGSETLRECLMNKKVALGLPDSGDRAMSRLLLRHLGLKGSIQEMFKDVDAGSYYKSVELGFADPGGPDQLDAAFLTVGPQAPLFGRLAATGQCEIHAIPDWEALLDDHLYLSPYTIHPGRYGTPPLDMPPVAVQTVASGAQLLTSSEASSQLVETVTAVVLDKRFARQNGLKDLFESQNREFAKMRPEFPIHHRARSIYDPAFDVHLIESWEAFYSLAVSILIAVFLGFRWLRRRRARAKEHGLDRYMQALLTIERNQISLDREGQKGDADRLQMLLDEVTALRQEALSEFTAHELTEDRAINCFIRMCHALSDKINAKLSRQRLDMMMGRLIEMVGDGNSEPGGASTRAN